MVVISRLTLPASPQVMPRPMQSDGGAGFRLPSAAGETGPIPVPVRTGGTAAISSSMMLALQERGARDDADEQARRHGHLVLDELRRLQKDLLAGGDGCSLDRLAELARIEPGDVDPVLAGVVGSIRLRARIELERRTSGRPSV